jgi:AcrR family transcriptional regulator
MAPAATAAPEDGITVDDRRETDERPTAERRTDEQAATRAAAAEVRRSSSEAARSARDAARAATDASHAAGELGRSVGADARREADRTRRIARSTQAIVKQAIAEAREALKDTSVEIRFERLSRDERRQRTRERLLDAAAEVFNRLGYQGASLDAVAEAAGYTKGAVYSNFATKGELFAALLERYSERRLTEQEQLMERVPLEDVAQMAGQALAEQARSEGTWDLLQIEFWLAAMRDPELRAHLIRGSDELYERSGRRFDRKFAEAGLHPPFSGVEFAQLANALGTGLLIQLYLQPDSMDPGLFSRALRLLAGLPATAPEADPGS